MMDLFNKLDEIQVDTACLLSSEDKSYCEALLEKYRRYRQFFQETSANLRSAWTALQTTLPPDERQFSESRYLVDKLLMYLEEHPCKLEEAFIRQLEGYFEKSYQLEFTGYYLEEDRREGVYLDSYEPVISNLTRQIGSDLAKAGREAIIRAFSVPFLRDSNAQLSGTKIILPDYYVLSHYVHDCLSHSDTHVSNLLHLLTLHVYGATQLPGEFDAMYIEWQNRLVTGERYDIADIGIRFYKNGCVHLLFGTASEARRFFITYGLQPGQED